MTELEQRACRALPGITFSRKSGHVKIANRIYRIFLSDPMWPLSEEEQADLWFLLWRYRRQIDDRELVAHAEELLTGAMTMSL